MYMRVDIKYYVCRAQSPALLAAAAGLAPAARRPTDSTTRESTPGRITSASTLRNQRCRDPKSPSRTNKVPSGGVLSPRCDAARAGTAVRCPLDTALVPAAAPTAAATDTVEAVCAFEIWLARACVAGLAPAPGRTRARASYDVALAAPPGCALVPTLMASCTTSLSCATMTSNVGRSAGSKRKHSLMMRSTCSPTSCSTPIASSSSDEGTGHPPQRPSPKKLENASELGKAL